MQRKKIEGTEILQIKAIINIVRRIKENSTPIIKEQEATKKE